MKKVLLLDDDLDLCYVMGELLSSFDAESTTIHSVRELKALTQLDFDLAILDVNLGNNVPNGIDAYHWLVKNNFQGKIAFFTGHAQSNPIVQDALKIPNVRLLEKPASIDKIVALMR